MKKLMPQKTSPVKSQNFRIAGRFSVSADHDSVMALPLPISYKVVLLGASAVGKSSIVQRLVLGTFSADGRMTSGADFHSYSSTVGDETVKLQIWDTAGQERFRSISKAYFRNAVAGVLVFDITDVETFKSLTGWLSDFQQLAAPNAFVLLIANKIDRESERQVGPAEVRAFGERHQLEVIETSAASGENVAAAFTRLTLELVMRMKDGKLQAPQIPTEDTIHCTLPVKRKGKCCA
jgi:small GTP-binding protein